MAVTPDLVAPAPASPLAFLGTLLLGWLFFAFTAQVAASFLLPDPPWRRALVVGVAPALASVVLVRFPPLVIVAVGLAADAVAVHRVYDVPPRTTAAMVVVHYAATLALVVAGATLLALLSTAPG